MDERRKKDFPFSIIVVSKYHIFLRRSRPNFGDFIEKWLRGLHIRKIRSSRCSRSWFITQISNFAESVFAVLSSVFAHYLRTKNVNIEFQIFIWSFKCKIVDLIWLAIICELCGFKKKISTKFTNIEISKYYLESDLSHFPIILVISEH